MAEVNERAVTVVPQGQLLRPIATPSQLIDRHKEITELIRDSLEEGKDFGPIPGTNGKNVLLKPGAERLCVAFGCHPEYRILESATDHDRENVFYKQGEKKKSIGFYRYVIACDIVKDGKTVGSGAGSCSTMESKYISRPRDVENTILKMAQKRALVAAVVNTFALSERFTQDLEDEVVEKPAADTSDATTTPQPKVFDTSDTEMMQRLHEVLEGKVERQYWDTIASRLMGKSAKDLPGIIKEVLAEVAN